MEQRKGKRQLNQGVRVKRTEEKEKRADRSAERTREATAVRAKRTTESRAARGAKTSLGQKLKAIHGKVRKAVHESRERNFPESNGVAGQLLLLLCGLAAYWGALGREKLRLARRSHIRRTGGTSRAAKWRRKKYYPLAFGGAALVIAATAVFVSRYTFGTTVIYEGQALDTVASELEAKRVTASIADITSETLGKTFTFSDSSIQYTSGLVERSAVVDRAELEEELTDEMGLVTQGYSLYINDELIGSTQYEGALEGLLDQLKESYISEDTLTVDFVEDVRIAKGYVPTESIMNLGQIAEILNSTKEGEVTYTVVKGDTWSGIANSHGMTTKELLAINPDFDINRLQIGDELTLSNAVPYLTVMVTERQNYVEDIQYDITYTDDATMYKGDYKVLSKGVYGTADVVADVTYVNGEETERTVISSVTLTEPVTEQRAQGTKARPSWYPTGSFRWPTSGRITSYFGYRNTGIRGASTNHRGIDISVSYGTPIYAADGGVVYRGASSKSSACIQAACAVRRGSVPLGYVVADVTACNEKIAAMFERDGFDISLAQLREEYPDSVLGRPHFCEHLMRKGYISSVKEGFEKFLGEGKPYYLPKRRISIAKAVETIVAAGGVPVLAHPMQYHYPEPELIELIETAKALGIRALEAYYSEFSAEQTAWLLRAAEKYGMGVSGGSDYHGTRKTHISMGMGCGNLAIPFSALEGLRKLR